MTGLFEAARRVSALDVANHAGHPVRMRGARGWMCCPMHGERTPSLVLYPDGGWKCYGCGRGGSDGVSLWAALHDVGQGEAARAVLRAFGMEAGADARGAGDGGLAAGRRFARAMKAWREEAVARQREAARQADAAMDRLLATSEDWDATSSTREFGGALYARELANRMIERLEGATVEELYQMQQKPEP